MKHSFSSIGLLETSHELDVMNWECKRNLQSPDQIFEDCGLSVVATGGVAA